ncbi:MAG: ATP-binding protein [Gammaproteobacteria bacterium]
MPATEPAIEPSIPIESVLCTDELLRRPARPPDCWAENQALLALAQELTHSPGNVLQRLVDIAMSLCRAHSAGLSLLEEARAGCPSATGDQFRWYAVAGQWKPLLWTTTPRNYGPCGTVLERNSALLMANVHRHFTQFAGIEPRCVEALLVPFHVEGQVVGTVWVVAHYESRKFDAEDRRLLQSLATFAATAYQARSLITAQAKANERLQAENRERERAEEALREADRRKTEFLAMLAHELRNPLAPIRNAAEILRLAQGDVGQVHAMAELVQRQLAHMERLIDDLLDLSRISRGKIELRRAPIDLGSAVHRAVEAIQPLCDRMRHRLTVSLPPEAIHLHGDAIRLAQVVGNLLNNACKFSEDGGHIRLSIERDGACALLRVQDSGMGIDRDHLPRIFDMFAQVDSSIERSRDGLGIGLTLVKTLVEMHGGSVEAHSAGLGLGSEFLVRLPLLAVEPLRPQDEQSRAETAPTGACCILVVDDNRDACDSLALLLGLDGHEVHTAYDGHGALAAAEQRSFDVILLDLGLPGLNGYELARRLGERRVGQRPLTVAITGWGQDEDRRRTDEAGFDAHLVKPVDFRRLTELLPAARSGGASR